MSIDWRRVNYLNHGDSLEILERSHGILEGHVDSKKAIEERLQLAGHASQYLSEVIRAYGGRRRSSVNLEQFRYDVEHSAKLHSRFTALECRGFSHALYEDIDTGANDLRDDVNFAIALMPEDNLFYPPRVRRYLRRVFFSHYVHNGYPAICFALGKMSAEACCVCVLQSDLAFRQPAFVRDHFRGWRKVLFESIAFIVHDISEVILLPKAADVARICSQWRDDRPPPASWNAIYERTAEEFGLLEARLAEPMDIQIYKGSPSVWVENIYRLELGGKGG